MKKFKSLPVDCAEDHQIDHGAGLNKSCLPATSTSAGLKRELKLERHFKSISTCIPEYQIISFANKI